MLSLQFYFEFTSTIVATTLLKESFNYGRKLNFFFVFKKPIFLVKWIKVLTSKDYEILDKK
ncbi:hypothetical protein CD33_13260 [Ureibacillus sinduriensis BLB-1 = JCM 15800]|uniref:Uncharacterized protein n=1 Tax=Ureibacillus sinduriensis BLB-1 = JCM 15800 TaxID=1384057 RepID=A0A0A3HU62_9BACL|nr:hypothetical protein CD33_13260 [Ureibacillus sinduriensis BLB-1 = JCM 15800]